MANPDRPPSFGWSVLAAIVVIAAVFMLVGAIVGIILGFLRIVVLVLLCVVVITWATKRKASR
jgi:Flp pilus assembly protein TadB